MRIPMTRLLVAVGVTAACASSRAAHPASPAAAAAADSSSRPPIGETFAADQLSRSAASNVYDALQQLEPEVLTGHGRGAPDVYVDRVMQSSGVNKLKELSLAAVRDVTYLRADQTQSQNLTDSQSIGGAILVRLR